MERRRPMQKGQQQQQPQRKVVIGQASKLNMARQRQNPLYQPLNAGVRANLRPLQPPTLPF
jgi:hypothetical protein